MNDVRGKYNQSNKWIIEESRSRKHSYLSIKTKCNKYKIYGSQTARSFADQEERMIDGSCSGMQGHE